MVDQAPDTRPLADRLRLVIVVHVAGQNSATTWRHGLVAYAAQTFLRIPHDFVLRGRKIVGGLEVALALPFEIARQVSPLAVLTVNALALPTMLALLGRHISYSFGPH